MFGRDRTLVGLVDPSLRRAGALVLEALAAMLADAIVRHAEALAVMFAGTRVPGPEGPEASAIVVAGSSAAEAFAVTESLGTHGGGEGDFTATAPEQLVRPLSHGV